MRKLRLQLALARRLLTTRRSYSAAGSIAAVAVCGVAIATAAIICVLSVFNGFHNILTTNLNRTAPDVIVEPVKGKTFPADSLLDIVKKAPDVADVMPVLTDNALAIYQNQEFPVTLRGVDLRKLSQHTAIDSLIIAGKPAASPDNDTKNSIMSVGVATQLGYYSPGEAVLLFAPRRFGRINTANPIAGFVTDSTYSTGIFETRQLELDLNSIYADISVAQKLFDRPGEASSLEITAAKGIDAQSLAKNLRKLTGDNFTVKDRLQQAEMNYRMVEIEKWVSFLLLFFILIIASFNIVSTLSMIVLDKQRSISVLHALGMSRRQLGGIFFWESCYITIIGGVSGMILGLILCLLQQHFGFIRLNSDPNADMMVSAYPVIVKAVDFAATAIPLILIGIATGCIASAFAKSRITGR